MKLISILVVLLCTTASAEYEPSKVGELSMRQQTRIVERTQVLKLWSFQFGPSAVSNMNNEHLMYGLTVGRHWEVNENAEILANIHTTLPSQGRASYTSFGLGGSWFATARDISPIIGAELGYAYAFIPNETDKSGFSVGAHAGVRLFRTAAAQMGVEGYIKSILFAAGSRVPVDYGLGLSVLY